MLVYLWTINIDSCFIFIWSNRYVAIVHLSSISFKDPFLVMFININSKCHVNIHLFNCLLHNYSKNPKNSLNLFQFIFISSGFTLRIPIKCIISRIHIANSFKKIQEVRLFSCFVFFQNRSVSLFASLCFLEKRISLSAASVSRKINQVLHLTHSPSFVMRSFIFILDECI